MRLSQRGLLWILIGAMAVLLIVAAGSAAVYFVLRQQEGTPVGWSDPVQSTIPERIAADLALYPLVGASAVETIDAATATGQLETAYAMLVFGQELTDARRIGRLLSLGEQFVAAGEPQRASLCYQQVYDLAVLSPRLNEPLRADALLASGLGWSRAERADEALGALDQAYALVVGSPFLQRAHRRELLVSLEVAYGALGAEDRAVGCREQIAGIDQGRRFPEAGVGTTGEPLLGDGEGVSSPEIGALEETRRQSAFALLEVLSDGGPPPAGPVERLAQALLEEDSAKLTFYRLALDGAPGLAKRVEIDRQIIRWLLLKYQVATSNLGLSLVPEWEGQATQIEAELSRAYEDLYFDLEDLVSTLPDASAMAPGSYQVRRDLILAGRLGQYPNFPSVQLAEKLQDAVSALRASGLLPGLYVRPAVAGEVHGFVFDVADRSG